MGTRRKTFGEGGTEGRETQRKIEIGAGPPILLHSLRAPDPQIPDS